MKLLKILVILIAATSLLSCNKSDKTENKDTKTSDQTTNSSDTKTLPYKFYKISKTESSGKEKIAPEITWNENGKDVKLSQFKGNVVVINLWATWCKPCVGEMPDLSALSQELKDKNLKMFGISSEDGKTIENFLKAKPVEYPILNGTEETFDILGKAVGQKIDGIPVTFIIDKDGKIVEYMVGAKSKQAFKDLITKYL